MTINIFVVCHTAAQTPTSQKLPAIIGYLLFNEEAKVTVTRKNILLIVGDDIGVDNVSVYAEHPQSAETPTLDQLANDGVLFRNTWANPQCSPTRASFLTGRHAFRHGVTHPGNATSTLASEEETIAELLSDAGYQTALFGKWHLGAQAGVFPTDQGFDYYSGSLFEEVDDYNNWEKNVITSQGGTPTTVEETDYATEVVAQEAVAWINNTNGPWFAEVSFNAPHRPFHVPPTDRFDYMNSGTIVGVSAESGDSCMGPGTAAVADCYRAAAEAMDSYIADILAQIDVAKLADTVIIFLGDNGTPGPVIVEVSGFPFAQDRAKSTVYEGGVNVPLIISAGSNIDLTPSDVSDLIQIQDVFSTIADLTDVQSTNGIDIDGQSLSGYLNSSNASPLARSSLFSELTNSAQNIDVWAHSDGVNKYIYNNGIEECYDLVNDSGELNSLSGNAMACNTLKSSRPNAN